jgi:hypothetical protein
VGLEQLLLTPSRTPEQGTKLAHLPGGIRRLEARETFVRNPFASRNLPAAVRRRVELAIAVAQEKLLQTHVDHALMLIQVVGEQVPFDEALDIYNRLLRLNEDEARVITTRALAKLGEESGGAPPWPESMTEPDADSDEEERRSFLDHLRSRLRGRVNEELRRWIELAAARTEVALLHVHVENALNFVEILDKEVPFTEAAELYLDALEVRDSVAEIVYYFALARIADDRLPKQGARQRAGNHDLRLVDQGGA